MEGLQLAMGAHAWRLWACGISLVIQCDNGSLGTVFYILDKWQLTSGEILPRSASANARARIKVGDFFVHVGICMPRHRMRIRV